MSADHYTLGRGELHFSRFKAGTQIGEGFRYIGNSPEFNLTFESDKLDHFNSDRGVREKDRSVTLQVNRSGSIVTDEITPDNLAVFFMSENGVETISDVGATVTDEQINAVIAGRSYQIGATTSDPVGASNITYPGSGGTLFSVKNDAGSPVTYVAGTDYTVDPVRGFLTLIEGGAIVTGTNLRVTYTTTSASRKQVRSGSEAVEGVLKYITRNAAGIDVVYDFPWISVSPNGDFGLKSESDWQTLPLSIEIQRKAPLEAIYMNGLPYNP